ncbi:MAG TPA: serine/threonine-protein kinase [Thermoanaerobaculia bacterium]|nr:serine/threonine-protein kinase [Thermoanaerobaculia bacterium]
MLIRTFPTRLVPPLAVFKLALGLVAFWATWGTPASQDATFPYVLHALLSVAFGITGALLLLGGRADRRAVTLGAFFVAAATSWSNRPLRLFSAAGQDSSLFSLANALQLDAFMAYFLWRFVRDFPAPPASLPSRRRMQLVVRVSAVAGTLLFLVNLLGFAVQHAPGGPGPWAALTWFAPKQGQGFYYGVVLTLTIAAFPLLLWKARSAQRDDQRRARVFLQMLALSFGPMIVEMLFELFLPGYHLFLVTNPEIRKRTLLIGLLPALTLPATIPYTVLVHRVLDVRLIARRALQYTLARFTALALVAVPLAALTVYLFVHRGQRLDQIFSGSRVLLLLAAIAVGIAALRYRRLLLDAVDRRFFREQYDARQILTLLVDRIRSIQEAPSLAGLVSREIDLALHLEGIAMLVLDPRSGMLADPRSRTRKLDASSPLALFVSSTSEPLEVELENPHSPLLKLPERERRWLAENGFRLLVPILSRDGSLLGLLGLGEKKSRLPFLKEDRQLLHAIASNAAWVLELEQERTLTPVSRRRSWQDPLEEDDPTPAFPTAATAPPAPSVTELARECPKCGALHPSYTVFCGTCSKKLETSRVPYVLPGKFRFEQRLGAGGMGVVYSGADLALGRHVAIKTLRQVSAEDAMRLRREARTAAAVSHPHLAPIYGMETWQGVPMLVMELLEGGTLAHRVTQGGGIEPRETVDLGVAMAGALGQLHAADILHRDIKPSNIGYTRDGVPKLMDFGIARVMFELRREDELEGEDEEEGDELVPSVSVWIDDEEPDLPRRRFVGTLSYLSPEALEGEPADETFDLWSLCVVLYECLLGRKVFLGTDQQVVERILSGRVPEFSQVCPEHPAALGEFFREALHRRPDRRPATAQELRQRLETVRTAL